MANFTGREGTNGIVLPVHVHRLQREQQSRTALESSRFFGLNHNPFGVSAFGDDRFALDHHRPRDGDTEMMSRPRVGGHGLVQNHVDFRVLWDRDGVGAPLGAGAHSKRERKQKHAARDEVVPLAQAQPL